MVIQINKILERINALRAITYEKVLNAHNTKPKRICFKSKHSNSLREIDYNDVKWALNLPFAETIKKIFESETDLRIFKKRNGKYWCPIKEEEDFNIATEFKSKYEANVFLRDTLDLSIALSEHMDENENRTEIGELEFQAKYRNCRQSLNEIINLVENFIVNAPYYKNSDFICAVPSSDPEKINLPNQIAKKLSNLNNISDKVKWKNEKKQLKELSFEEKWEQLVETDMQIDINLKNKVVILLDDLYQSGTTIQYVAMKLQEAGAKRIYGLTIVKSRRDTDNT